MDLSRGGMGGWRRRAPPSARLSLRGETVCVCFLILMFKVFLFLALFLNVMSISYKWAKKIISEMAAVHLRQVLRKTIAVIAAHFPVVVY